MSSPPGVAITKAGRRFTVERSEKGKGTTTTSLFTNRSMPRSPRADASLSGAWARLRER